LQDMLTEAKEVAKVSEIPLGTMKRVKAADGSNVLLSNVGGTIYATQGDCGHQRANLAKGKLEGKIVSCPLHGAQFDVTTGQNVSGIQMHFDPNMMQKLPPELVQMFQRTAEVVSEIEVLPLKTYRVEVRGDSIFVENA
jgi:nitrite reductase/ring-hydroxylating ferredoxin subunit